MNKKLASLLIILLAFSTIAQEIHTKYMKITPEIQEKIKAAIPKDFQKPAQARKVVVFSKSSTFVHASTSVGIETIKQLAALGVFEVTFNDDATTYTEEYLKQFDAIIVNNATSLEKSFTAEANRLAFSNFVKNGKALIGIHAATDGGNKEWPEYSEMFGGRFSGHPWQANGKWAFAVNDTESPINKSFTEKLFIFKDEIYNQAGPYKKENMHTLVKIDAENDPLKAKVKHDREYPVSWMKKHGEGKVFYTCFGHNPETYYDAKIVDHMLRGMQWALGDLQAELVLGK